jgi:hypothetical protein
MSGTVAMSSDGSGIVAGPLARAMGRLGERSGLAS